jgi:hypothetical protein
VEAELRKEPTANEGACNSYEEVADEPEPGPLHNLTGQPSGNETNHQNDQETFTRHVHLRIPLDQQTAANYLRPRKRKSHQQDGLAESEPSPVRRVESALRNHAVSRYSSGNFFDAFFPV